MKQIKTEMRENMTNTNIPNILHTKMQLYDKWSIVPMFFCSNNIHINFTFFDIIKLIFIRNYYGSNKA
jgi:hypothetical protein